MGPSVSVAVCTRNRSRALARCLDSLAAQRFDSARTEILVVDNGSTDGTAAVVAGRQARLPRLRSLSEPVPGLSRARNLHG